MDTLFYDAEASLGFMSITANRLMSGFLRKRLMAAGLDLTAEQWGVLVQIWNRGSLGQDDLAHILCVDKSSLSRVLDIMERKGLVRRMRDPGDARRRILYATEKADGMKEDCLAVVTTVMAVILEGADPEEHAVCLRVLTRIKNNVREIST